MHIRKIGARTASLAIIAAISSCAGIETKVTPPAVTLTSVEMTDADLNRQAFLLGFDVSNPNPFPLPVKSLRYRVRLDDQQFASGETQGNFTVPSESSAKFKVSVELDLLKTTSRLFSLVSTGMRRNIDYELSGSFAVDIPFTKPLTFSNSGRIELRAAAF